MFLACFPHYTSGQTYYYPAFNAGRSEDALKFAHEFGQVLAMPIMLEAIMRVRASRGVFLYLVFLHRFLTLSLARIADGIFPWQLFRSFDGSPGDAGRTPRPGIHS